MSSTAYSMDGIAIVRRAIQTPEGVPVHFGIARAGDRLAALLADGALLFLTLIAVAVVGILLALVAPTWIVLVLVQLAVFGLWIFWWPYFELRGNGASPGKRWLGLRVVDRHGGTLTAEAIFTRNLMRLVEMWIPLIVLLTGQSFFSGATGLSALLSSAWLGVFALVPLLNRDRLRLGDLAAGTMVVYAPRTTLLADLSRAPAPSADADAARTTFTAAQLDHYGIRELQVLEELLRDRATQARTLKLVCEKIQRKIGWPREQRDVDPGRFLRDFYDAQRGRLEGRLLMGERRERKTESRPKPPAARDPRRRPRPRPRDGQ